MSQDTLHDTRDLGAFIPSSLDDHGLDPYEFRIYSRIVRRAGKGEAWESVSSMARACKIGEQKTKEVIRFLLEAGMIQRESRPGMTSIYRLTPQHKWLHPELLDSARKKASYHPGVLNTQVGKTPRSAEHPGVLNTQDLGVLNTQDLGVLNTHKGNPVKVIQKEDPIQEKYCRLERRPANDGVGSDGFEIRPQQACGQTQAEESAVVVESVENEESPKRAKPVKKSGSSAKDKQTAREVYESLEHLDLFKKFWVWYCRKGREIGFDPGSQRSAAIAWRDNLESRWERYEDFRRGTVLWFAKNNGKPVGTPNACRFLSGSRNHLDPWWESALEEQESLQSDADGFVDDVKVEKQRSVKAQVAATLRELRMNAGLPAQWQKRFGVQLSSELNEAQAGEYLEFLKQERENALKASLKTS